VRRVRCGFAFGNDERGNQWLLVYAGFRCFAGIRMSNHP
jgi:hypothetical protein